MYDYDYIYRQFCKGKLEPFYQNLYPGLLAYAVKYLGSEFSYLAEDCVQDALISSYAGRKGFVNSRAWYSYILKVVNHNCFAILKRNDSRARYLKYADLEENESAIESIIFEQETLDSLYEAIQSLPEKYKEILRLSFNEGLKNAEIAVTLGIAEITVKKNKAKILQILRDKLGDYIPYWLLIVLLEQCFELTESTNF